MELKVYSLIVKISKKLGCFNGLSATSEIKINKLWRDFYGYAQAVMSFFRTVVLILRTENRSA